MRDGLGREEPSTQHAHTMFSPTKQDLLFLSLGWMEKEAVRKRLWDPHAGNKMRLETREDKSEPC
ncbi:hypothetical protein IHE44_0011818 [Lamprotornis superbus]|uniref:Uncharacterized protein n=1 Tax=Lamprotornis superbus TaxID=245042 RepID=A0A835TMD0_9PASS|nr:hypothetical protein IHE44_0011818 [Lamprotornis superbus]